MDVSIIYDVLCPTKFVPPHIKHDAPALCYLIKYNTLLTFVLINLHRQVAGSAEPVVLCYLRQGCQTPMGLPGIKEWKL
jgi:hypothetical protein